MLTADIPKIFKVFWLRLITVLDPFHLLGTIVFNAADLKRKKSLDKTSQSIQITCCV